MNPACHEVAVKSDDGANKQGVVDKYKVSPEYSLNNEVLIYLCFLFF